jgi:drug/metabolite transporter (DMT)-like permease
MSARAWAAFGAMSAIWGVPYLFIKIAVDHGVPPATVAFARLVLGAAVLLPLAWRARVLSSLKGHWGWIVMYALFEMAIPYPLIAFGEQHVASSLAAIVIATTPLGVTLLAFRFDPSERPNATRLVGLLIGFAGVIAFVGIDVAGRSGELLGTGAILLAAAGYAIGPMIYKLRLATLDPRASMSASLSVAAVGLAPLAFIDAPHHFPPLNAIAAIVVLGLVCTAAGFVIFGVLIADAGPSRSLVITYINPVVAVGLGVALLGERPGAGAIAGLLLILAGSWLSTDGRLPPGLAAVATRIAPRPRRAAGTATRRTTDSAAGAATSRIRPTSRAADARTG